MMTMQQQVATLTQNVVEQQQRMFQPVAPAASAPLSPINVPLPQLPPSPWYPPCLAGMSQQEMYVPPPPVRQKEPTIAAPLHFTGKCNKTKLFINSYTLYMNGWKSEFPDEDAKIYWILSYMTIGAAKTWRDYVVSLMYRHQHSFSSGDELLQ